MNPEIRPWLLLALALAGYLALMVGNPVRASLRDGFRCIHRYPALWGALAVFGVCYAAFRLGLRLFEFQPPSLDQPILEWSRPWFFPRAFQLETAREAILPASEGVAGIFNNVITTYPFSALAALLLLVNWRGHHRVLTRALRDRYGRRGGLISAGISLCAGAALVKPVALYLCVPQLARYFPGSALLPASYLLNWLSFLFEYLFGVCVQVFLILLVYVWVRGVSFTHGALLDFAIRRFSSVMKWAFVVLIVSSLLIDIPRIFSTLPPISHRVTQPDLQPYVDEVARPLLAIFLIVFSTLQITLVFHSESLRRAIRAHFRFLRENWDSTVWFLIVAWVHCYAFHYLRIALVRGLGERTVPGVLWQLTAPLLEAFVAGWLLASWVCVFKRAETGHSQTEEWVAF